MQYIEAIATLIVVFIIPAAIIIAIVGAPDSSRRAAQNAGRTPDRSRESHG